MKYLNLGCGYRFHPTWINVDFTSTGKDVIAHDLTKGIPFPNKSFDAVYHSHVLEHFPKSSAQLFLVECYRVLRPAGILRVAVPNLEQITRAYIEALEKARDGSAEWSSNYDWIILELYDQTVRSHSGGEMRRYLQQPEIPNLPFILNRLGVEAERILASRKKIVAQSSDQPIHKNRLLALSKTLNRLVRSPDFWREKLLKWLLGEEYELLQLGRFRCGGEVHQWMYDPYSLERLLTHCGFQKIVQRTATESYIPGWQDFHLDTEPDGTVYKPDSLYMEAVKL